MDTSAPVKDSIQAPAVTTGKASNRISALAEQVFGPSAEGKKVSAIHFFLYCFLENLYEILFLLLCFCEKLSTGIVN